MENKHILYQSNMFLKKILVFWTIKLYRITALIALIEHIKNLSLFKCVITQFIFGIWCIQVQVYA